MYIRSVCPSFKGIVIWILSINAFSVGGNVKVTVLSFCSNFCAATRDLLNESSSNCLSSVKIVGLEVCSFFRKNVSELENSENESKNREFNSFEKGKI